MSSKNAKKSEQRKSNQQQDGAQPSQSEQIQLQQSVTQPVPGGQIQPPQVEQVQQPMPQIEQAQAQPEQQNQPTAVIPSQAYQNQTQYQYVYVNYSRKSNVIGLSIVYAISLFLTIGPCGGNLTDPLPLPDSGTGILPHGFTLSDDFTSPSWR